MLLLLLAACAELPTRQEAIDHLEQSPVCCQSLSGISYAPFPADTTGKISIDSASPAFEFDTGKSFFVAYTLPDRALPYRLVANSYPVGYGPADATIFEPTMSILDSDYNVLCTTPPGTFTFTRQGFFEGFKLTFSVAMESMFYEGAIVVDDPRAKYLLVYTSTEDIEAGVPYEYMGFAQVYSGCGYWIPIPTGKQQVAIGHSPFGMFRLDLASVHAADLARFSGSGSPADQDRYPGNGFSIGPPRSTGYRIAEQSSDLPGKTVSQLQFVSATPSGSILEAYAHSILLDADTDALTGDPLTQFIDRTINAQRQTFSDYRVEQSEITIKGTSCRRIDFTYKARNPLLLIVLPARGYDIYCVHPGFSVTSYPMIIRVGVHYGYAYGETTEGLPDELAGYFNRIQFDAAD